MAQQTSYDDDRGSCVFFLQNYYSADDPEKAPKYMYLLDQISDREIRRLDVEVKDLKEFFSIKNNNNMDFVRNVELNTRRYVKLFAEAADSIMPEPTRHDLPEDVFDVMSRQRQAIHNMNEDGNPGNQGAQKFKVPASLTRRYDVYIIPDPSVPRHTMRQVSAQHIGHLVKVKGMVTHITDVKPLVTIVTYTDPETGIEVYQEVTGRTFMPIDTARSEYGTKGAPVMETRGSKFTKFQEARIQEMADEVPEGATPRTMSVQLRGEICRSMKPGDEVELSGIYLPEPFTGFRAMRAGLLTTTYLEVQHVKQVKTSYAQHRISRDEMSEIQELAEGGDMYARLAKSIAPEIFGHEDVKKVLLLALVGGVTRTPSRGLKIRGDVHICLMGDPGVAKSQMLKFIARVSPRAVYTTGKGSSGVGLTAAVLRNQVTKELVLEGGALVLADKGICCIDEFDKMEDGDRTAIHEVMEQQTVSIAKAGITTTLNTRTTILAAANPAWGRYDKRRTPSENINLPAALLSRFDILWLMLDEPSADIDRQLADHVLKVHRTRMVPGLNKADGLLSPPQLRTYIACAKTFEPVVPESLSEYVANIYAEMRQQEKSEVEAATYTTPRTLLSILRLAQAVAKLRFDEVVCQSDIDEALRLMRQSKSSLTSEREAAAVEDPVSLIYRRIREHAERTSESIYAFSQIKNLCARDKVVDEDIRQCITEYGDIGVWQVEEGPDGFPVIELVPM